MELRNLKKNAANPFIQTKFSIQLQKFIQTESKKLDSFD